MPQGHLVCAQFDLTAPLFPRSTYTSPSNSIAIHILAPPLIKFDDGVGPSPECGRSGPQIHACLGATLYKCMCSNRLIALNTRVSFFAVFGNIANGLECSLDQVGLTRRLRVMANDKLSK